MPSSDVSMLMDMGFTLSKAEKALQMTGNKGVEPAMEWLLAHSDDSEPSAESSDVEASGNAPPEDAKAAEVPGEAVGEAKSLKCDVCGKLFKSSLEVEFHATKSGHDSFSESLEEKKPLTEEEKKEKLRLLEERMKQKRKEREESEKQEAFEREKFRIKSGKEIAETRRRLEELEMKKLLEQRKREKEEDRLAREKVRGKIEADKAARRAKQAGESGQPPVVSPTIPTPPTPVTPAPKKDYNQTKIQIRLTNGETLTQTFGAKEQLSAVRLYVEINRTDPPGPFNLMTSFPRKVFLADDYDAPLDVLGLVPSAVVIVQKNAQC